MGVLNVMQILLILLSSTSNYRTTNSIISMTSSSSTGSNTGNSTTNITKNIITTCNSIKCKPFLVNLCF